MIDVKKLRELLAWIADYCQHEREDEPPYCSNHSDAPHGFDRNASHNEVRYVCTCEGWSPDPTLDRWTTVECAKFICDHGQELLAIAEAYHNAPVVTLSRADVGAWNLPDTASGQAIRLVREVKHEAVV